MKNFYQNKKTKKNFLGFTILEVVVVIIIIGIVASVIGPILYISTKAANTQYEISNVTNEGRVAVLRIARELRMMRTTDDLVMGANSITFSDVDGSTITYSLSGENLMRNSQALANHVTALSFTYQDADGAATAIAANVRYITVFITLMENKVTSSLQDTVFLRNV